MLIHNAVITGSLVLPSLLPLTGSLTMTGSIGINVSNPAVYGGVGLVVSGSATNSIARLAMTVLGPNNGLNIGDDGTDAVIGPLNSGTKTHILSRAGGVYARALTVDSANSSSFGGTTISTATDAATVTIKQHSTTHTNGIYLERSGERNGYYMYVGGAVDSLTFRRNYFGTQSDVMSLTRDGNVGIGTTSPETLLHINSSNAGGEGGYLYLDNPAASTSGNKAGIKFGTSSGASFSTTPTGEITNVIDNAGTGASALTFGTFNGSSSGERMRITSGGQISQTAPLADWSYVMTNSNASSPNGILIQYTGANKNSTSNQFIYCTDNFGSDLRFSVRSNGGIANFQANNVNLSDERTKKDIIPLESYWDKFKAIEIVKFKYKDQTHDDFNIGVIAQQVEKIAPEFIDVEGWEKPEYDEEGNLIIKEEEPLKSIYTADLHHATIKVLQEAMAKIEQLEAKVTALENK